MHFAHVVAADILLICHINKVCHIATPAFKLNREQQFIKCIKFIIMYKRAVTCPVNVMSVATVLGTQMIRGSHRSGKVAQHTCCVDDTWYISLDEREIETELGVSLLAANYFIVCIIIIILNLLDIGNKK